MNQDGQIHRFSLNGAQTETVALPGERLSSVLRDRLGLTGTKIGCDAGDCGSCTVLLDNRAVCACLTPVERVAGRSIVTVEGLEQAGLEALKRSFTRHGAAQCGICTPGMLMTAAGLLARNAAPNEADVEQELGGVLCRCTGYRKIIEAVVNAGAADPILKSPASGMAVGARLPRLDGDAKVDGTECFGADYRPDGSHCITIVRSPFSHAGFKIGDIASWIAGTPSVVAVFTAKDIPGANRFGVLPGYQDQPALAEEVANFRGEGVAIVVSALPLDDLKSFPIAWQERSATFTVEQSAAHSESPVNPGYTDNRLITGRVISGMDVTESLEKSRYVATGAMETAHVEHACIEPEAGAAWMEGKTVVIRACTQAPHMDRDQMAQILGLPDELVRIIPSAVGGGFGTKLDLSVQTYLGLAALLTGRPVYMTYSRRESMASTTKRHPAKMHSSIGCDSDGNLTALAFEGHFDTGPYASWGPTVANRVPVHATGPYRIPNVYTEATAMLTNGPNCGAFRGFGVPQAAISEETLIDQLADSAGFDRFEFRVKNALRDGDRTATGQQLQGVGIFDCFQALRPRWQTAIEEATEANRNSSSIRRGVGVAACWYGCGNTALPNPSTIRVAVEPDGGIILFQGAVDLGQGTNTVIPQICADAIGIPVERLTVRIGDTDTTPDAGKSSASRQTYVSGKAAELAGRSLRAQVLRHANVADPTSIAIEGPMVLIGNAPERRIDLSTLPIDSNGYVFVAEETYDPPTSPLDQNGQGVPYAVYGYGAQIAELEVDNALGTVRLLRITAAHDVGRAINPLLAEGQIEGGIAQGIGLALMEEYIAGRTENLHDYLIPTIGDVPPIDCILVEKPDPEGPFGAKGLGEHVLIPTAPAIFNAIRHATGAVITRLPALPHRVLKAIHMAGLNQ